jgi:phosphoadenosine phosphosulfate reductase
MISEHNYTDPNEEVVNLVTETIGMDASAALTHIAASHNKKVIFSTSFGIEDQAITHIIATLGLNIKVFSLDTGRLFPETYSVWDATLQKYKIKIDTFYPDATKLQSFITENGPNSFYDSVDNRKTCCGIRKVEPLKRALNGYDIWITGIRAEQSDNRTEMHQVEWDDANKIIKFHPLLHWTWDELQEYVKKNQVPINKLHDKGFVSIGCAPCTRAIKEGESFRDGRWWWEDKSKKECGLHSR